MGERIRDAEEGEESERVVVEMDAGMESSIVRKGKNNMIDFVLCH